MSVRLLTGDCRERLAELPAQSVHTCVTSPPYFGLRDYGHAGQIGLEHTPDAFVAEMVAVFREVHRVLRDDGTLWLNLGDSYASGTKGSGGTGKSTLMNDGREEAQRLKTADASNARAKFDGVRKLDCGLPDKNLIGIPWRVAFALQADGWYLRQDIIWAKPNPMPESVTDRCTKAHEYLFLLTKSPRYYFDAAAIAEGLAESSIVRLAQNVEAQHGSLRVPGKTNGAMKAVKAKPGKRAQAGYPGQSAHTGKLGVTPEQRNKRSVWTVATQPFKEAHFATYPPGLIEPCILAGCPAGGTVLDPFAGAGTTGLVADRLQRNAVLIELNPEYAALAKRRLEGDAGMFSTVEAA